MNDYYRMTHSTEKKAINIQYPNGLTVTRWKASRKFAVWEGSTLLACCEYLKGAKAVAARVSALINSTATAYAVAE